ARFAAFERKLAAFAAGPSTTGGGARAGAAADRLDAFARTALDARHAKALRRARKLDRFEPERLHRLRIALKKLRYAATYFAPAFASGAAKPYIEATVRLQGALGALNDRAVAAQVLADLATAARPTEDVAPLLKALAKQAASGEKRRRRKLVRAWADFRKVGRFWK
ncbi:MAG: CHAD domain-containing protein, partial [Reyranella sp.]|nr:CHAD domain-containing protein [Reyranella sp.]